MYAVTAKSVCPYNKHLNYIYINSLCHTTVEIPYPVAVADYIVKPKMLSTKIVFLSSHTAHEGLKNADIIIIRIIMITHLARL